jgi:hypothetical protein
MLPFGADWATISSLATAGGTLVLAVATFASVRSANRAARISEAALQEQRRPVFAPSRFDDPGQKIMFVDRHWVKAEGGRAAAEHVDGTVYLAVSLRNVGSGIGVCQGWYVRAGMATIASAPTHAPLEEFRRQSRDLYIPAGDIGMWQGALRNPDDRVRAQLIEAIEAGEPIILELLYSDLTGGQRTITRFGLTPAQDVWIANMNRHWYLDWAGPRAEAELLEAQEAVRRDREAHDRALAGEVVTASDSDGEEDGAAVQIEAAGRMDRAE